MGIKKIVYYIALLIALASVLSVIAMVFMVPQAHAAGTGMPLMEGLKNPTELAKLVERELKSGKIHSPLDPARCRKTGSCASAYDYFYGIRYAHPHAKLDDIHELPRYLRSLVKQPAPKGVWQLSRMLVKGETHRYDPTGWHRRFFKGEFVWYDPNTGEPTLASKCGNVVGKRLTSSAIASRRRKNAAASCYIVPFDYRDTPGIVLYKHAARAEFHFVGMTEADLERLDRSPCFGVHDATGIHVPFHRCDTCEHGFWPPTKLAAAVGLPKKEPSGVFTAPLAEGIGYLTLPRWATAYEGIYCVDVGPYAVSVKGFGDWTAVSRLDIVTQVEMRKTLSAGRLDRALSGSRHY